jgi:hypothetical protein
VSEIKSGQMRSVVIHLVRVTRDAVSARLSQFAQAQNSESWIYPPRSSLPVLCIEHYDNYEREFEQGELQPLIDALGQKPDVTVIANVSGRNAGDIELLAFAECLLSAFHGVAQDEYSKHCWSLAEIRSGAKQGGHKFFDYEGWHRSKSAG